ncbi:MAG TPA: polysaccharide deacetylase family protein [Gemmatimonadaceae bacterium]|jgi:peptidoglycan/xylan/chitin deacetylase (PgdA/CDA1 family)
MSPPILMYHELRLRGRSLCSDKPGYTRYVIDAEDFRSQLKFLREQGASGQGVGTLLERQTPPPAISVRQTPSALVGITFDDGCETDAIAAASALAETGFGATFYVVSGFVGRPGYLNETQIRDLAGHGFEIGSHTASHSYLTGLSEDNLLRELSVSKERLQQMLGRPVVHLSCPGGWWNSEVAAAAKSLGYHSVSTSNLTAAADVDPFCLPRYAVMRNTTADQLFRWLTGRNAWRRRAKNTVLDGVKRVVGIPMYYRLRGRLLGE